MGNTPSQEPLENEPAAVRDPDAEATVLGRLAGAVRSLAAGIRNRCSVLPGLDLRTAFDMDADRVSAIDAEDRTTDGDDETDAAVPARREPALPARDRPFTRPPADDDRTNPPDLRARKEDGQLSLYYPDREGAEITSDTWQRVER